MYKIDRRAGGGVQKSFTGTDLSYKKNRILKMKLTIKYTY